jgi:hypothetical protein
LRVGAGRRPARPVEPQADGTHFDMAVGQKELQRGGQAATRPAAVARGRGARAVEHALRQVVAAPPPQPPVFARQVGRLACGVAGTLPVHALADEPAGQPEEEPAR